MKFSTRSCNCQARPEVLTIKLAMIPAPMCFVHYKPIDGTLAVSSLQSAHSSAASSPQIYRPVPFRLLKVSWWIEPPPPDLANRTKGTPEQAAHAGENRYARRPPGPRPRTSEFTYRLGAYSCECRQYKLRFSCCTSLVLSARTPVANHTPPSTAPRSISGYSN